MGPILTALLMAITQVIVFPTLVMLWGDTQGSECLLLVAVYAGSVCGQIMAQREGTAWVKKTLFVARVVLIATSLVFYFKYLPIVEYAVTALWLKTSVTSVLLIVVALAGFMLVGELYEVGRSFDRRYWAINVSAALSVMGVCCLLYRYNTQNLYLIIAGLNVLGLIADRKTQGRRTKEDSFHLPEAVKTAFYGICSAGFVSIYLQLIQLSFWPTGLEFAFFLFLAFLFMGLCSSGSLRSFREYVAKDSTVLMQVGAGLMGLLLLFFHYLGFQSRILTIYPFSLKYISFIFGFLLFTPYLAFAAVLPVRELERPGLRHLLYNSVGNLTGFFLFYIFLGSLSLGLQVFLLMAGVFIVTVKHRPKMAMALVCVGLFVVLTDLEGRIIKNASLFLNQVYGRMGMSVSTEGQGDFKADLLAHYRVGREVGSLIRYNDKIGTTFVGLGSYRTTMSTLREIHEASVGEPWLKDQASILVLGLGGHQILTGITEILKEKKAEPKEIVVVDNFLPFQNSGFRDAVAYEGGFDWKEGNVKLEYEDVFQFAYRSRLAKRRFDVVFWNLTTPAYSAASKLHTVEFLATLKSLLGRNGVFIGIVDGLYWDEAMACLFLSAFPHTQIHPGLFREILLVGTGGATPVPPGPGTMSFSGISCPGKYVPSLAHPWQWNLNHNDVSKYENRASLIGSVMAGFDSDIEKFSGPWQLLPLSTRLSLAARGLGHAVFLSHQDQDSVHNLKSELTREFLSGRRNKWYLIDFLHNTSAYYTDKLYSMFESLRNPNAIELRVVEKSAGSVIEMKQPGKAPIEIPKGELRRVLGER